MAWRDIARPIIQKVINDNPGMNNTDLRRLMFKEYPFGARQWHPYKIWLDEIKVQLKERRFGVKKKVAPKEQIKLF